MLMLNQENITILHQVS